jgi:hypothetical protein
MTKKETTAQETKPSESKEEKFARLIRKRFAKLQKAVELVCNLGNTTNYKRTDEQREKLFDALALLWNKLAAAYAAKTESSNGDMLGI